MSCWVSSRATSSYVSKLDLTLCQPKVERSHCTSSQSACKDCCFGTVSGPVSSVPSAPNECGTKPGDFSGLHCSKLDITLEQKHRRKSPLNSTSCTCSTTAKRPHMPWRYSSSCSNSQGSQHCLGQGGFVHDHGCGFANSFPKKLSSVTIQSTSRSSSADDHIQPAKSLTSETKSQSWTSRLDVVLASNSAVPAAQIGKPHTIFTSRSEQPSKEYAENVTHVSNIDGVKMYISSCSLTVQPLKSKCQDGQPVLVMPQGENSSKEYSLGFQTPAKGFIVSEAPTLQITQFQLTRSPANTPSIQQTSTREIWMSPEKLPKVSGTSGTTEMLPNMLLFQRSCSPGCKTNLYPVILPSQHKASKVTLVIGSPVAPVPVQVIHEYSRSPTPAIYISNGDQPMSPEDLGSGYLLSVNPIAYSKPKHMEPQRTSSLLGTHTARCKPAEPYLCHSSPCTGMPRIQSNRDYNAPINISIETFGSRRGAVKISISHSRDNNSFGMGY